MKNISNKAMFLLVIFIGLHSYSLQAEGFWSSFRTPSVFRGLIVCFRPIQGFAQTLFDRFGFVNRTTLNQQKVDLLNSLQNNTKKVQQDLQQDVISKQDELIKKINQVDEEFSKALQDSQNHTDIQFNDVQEKVSDLGKQVTDNHQKLQKRFQDGDTQFQAQLDEVQATNTNRLNGLQQELEHHDTKVNDFIALINNNVHAMRNDFETMQHQVDNLKEPLTDSQRRQLIFALGRMKNDTNLLNKSGSAGALAITLRNQK